VRYFDASLTDEEVLFLQPDEIIQQLETQEFFMLDPVQKVQILKGLCLRIMGTYSVQDYMEEKQQEATKLW
jgi:bromodomain adjacent to zinc finger domain protein 1B